MAHKLATAAITLALYSTAGLALDLEREHLLDLYHGIDDGSSQVSSSQEEWVNLSAGIAPNYQEDSAEIEFAPLRGDEAAMKFGVFSDELPEADSGANTSDSDYKFSSPSPTQFGQSEDERYGVYMQKRF